VTSTFNHSKERVPRKGFYGSTIVCGVNNAFLAWRIFKGI